MQKYEKRETNHNFFHFFFKYIVNNFIFLIYWYLNLYIILKIQKKLQKNDLSFTKIPQAEAKKLGFWKEMIVRKN